MQKIPCLFVRDFKKDRLATEEVTKGCEWVLSGEGISTIKFDGTCCMVKGGKLFKRYDAKHGKTPPEGFIPAQDPDQVTGHWPGWVECDRNNPADKWHFEAFSSSIPDGTYELCGPKINGNKEGLSFHLLETHNRLIEHGVERSFDGIKAFLTKNKIEGIVFHHPDGRMAKIRRADFGLEW